MRAVVTTSLAVIGVPSLHLAPDLIFTVQVLRSDESVGMPSARPGMTPRFLSSSYRLGNMNWKERTDGRSPASNGLRVWASASMMYVRVPPSFTDGPDDPPHAAIMKRPTNATGESLTSCFCAWR